MTSVINLRLLYAHIYTGIPTTHTYAWQNKTAMLEEVHSMVAQKDGFQF